jgi:hypothetical protein
MVKLDKITVKKNLYIFLRCFMLVNILNDFNEIHPAAVTGSIPVPPTIEIKGLQIRL